MRFTFSRLTILSPFVFMALLCSFGICWGIDQIILELSRREGPGNGKLIARLEKKELAVRRKRANHYNWSNVAIGDSFYHRESLETGEHSKAILSFPMSPEKRVEVSENSLIVFDENAEFGLYLLNGVMTVNTQDTELKLVASPGSEGTIHNYTAKQLTPAANEELYVSKGEQLEVVFSWKASKKNQKLNLELASDANFTALLSKAVFTELSEKKFFLSAGKYYWRLKENKEVVSPTQSLGIFGVEALSLLSVEWPNKSNVLIKWNTPHQEVSPNKGAHFFELADDINFKIKRFHFPIDPMSRVAAIPRPPAGKYYARLLSSYGKLSLASQIQLVTIPNSNTDIKASPLASLWSNFTNGLSTDQNSNSKSAANRTPASDSNSASSNAESQEMPAQIAAANTEALRFPLSILPQKNSLLLSWTYPSTVDHWEIWLVDNAGKPTKKIADPIPAAWSAYNLDPSNLPAGSYFELIGAGASSVYSEIVSYSTDSASLPAPQNIRISATVVTGTSVSHDAKGAIQWDYTGNADGFHIFSYSPDHQYPQMNFEVSGNERSLLFIHANVYQAAFTVNVQAFRYSGGRTITSDISSATKCFGDVNGDGVVNQADLALIQANFGVAKYGGMIPGYSIFYPSPYDINGDGTVDSADVTMASAFLGQTCK